MDISEQASEIAGRIRDSWDRISFEKAGDSWNLIGPDGDVLTGISFSSTASDAEERTVAAVDGSSAVVLDAGSFLIGAVRVATVVYDTPSSFSEPEVSETEIIFLDRENYRDIYSSEYEAAYGIAPPSVPDSFADIIQRIRSMREMRAASSLMRSVGPGGILMTDGALKADVDTPDEFFRSLAGEVDDLGVTLLGISKRSALSFARLPLMALLRRKGAELFPDSEWCCYLGESSLTTEHQLGAIHLARLNRLSDYVFRIDAYPEDRLLPESGVLAMLSRYSADPSYLGYPFPLAQVHNASIIRRSEAALLAHRIEEEAVARGMSPGEWEGLFMNFHDVLDRGV